MAHSKGMPTIWETPDGLWDRFEHLLNEHDPPKGTGRGRENARQILDGLIFKFRTG